MAVEPDGAGDLTERVVRWAAAGERYEVEFKSESSRTSRPGGLCTPTTVVRSTPLTHPSQPFRAALL
jgi:hypothetical protein